MQEWKLFFATWPFSCFGLGFFCGCCCLFVLFCCVLINVPCIKVQALNHPLLPPLIKTPIFTVGLQGPPHGSVGPLTRHLWPTRSLLLLPEEWGHNVKSAFIQSHVRTSGECEVSCEHPSPLFFLVAKLHPLQCPMLLEVLREWQRGRAFSAFCCIFWGFRIIIPVNLKCIC